MEICIPSLFLPPAKMKVEGFSRRVEVTHLPSSINSFPILSDYREMKPRQDGEDVISESWNQGDQRGKCSSFDSLGLHLMF